MATNLNFYNLQSTRRYPLDDNATGTDDIGTRLRDNILVDCNLRFPSSKAAFAFVGGITVNARLVTVTILGAEAADAVSAFTPLAAVTLVKPVTQDRHYPVTPLTDGVGGWLVFGEGILEDFTARFSSPSQSLLLPKCARPYRAAPIPSIRKRLRSVGLTDVVNLQAGSDLEIVAEDLVIDGAEREAIVIRVTDKVGSRNPLADYTGPCGARPESKNCAKQGIENLNGAVPDCAGNIEIEFRGITYGIFQDCGGLLLDLDVTVEDACAKKTIGDEPIDACGFLDSQGSSAGSGGVVSSASSVSLSSAAEVCADLPYCTGFDVDASEFFVQSGTFAYTEGFESPDEECGSLQWVTGSSASLAFSSASSVESSSCYSSVSSDGGEPTLVEICDPIYGNYLAPYLRPYTFPLQVPIDRSYVAMSSSRKNIALLRDCDGVSVPRRCTVDLQVAATYVQRNGGIILNHHLVDLEGSPHYEYFFASVDLNSKQLRLLRWTGATFVVEQATSLPLVLNDWYNLRVDTEPGTNPLTTVNITVRLAGVSNPGFPTTTFTVPTNRYLPADGRFGVGSDRARARFSWFRLEELV